MFECKISWTWLLILSEFKCLTVMIDPFLFIFCNNEILLLAFRQIGEAIIKIWIGIVSCSAAKPWPWPCGIILGLNIAEIHVQPELLGFIFFHKFWPCLSITGTVRIAIPSGGEGSKVFFFLKVIRHAKKEFYEPETETGFFRHILRSWDKWRRV